ncbi:aspartyl protease [Histoplasma capsulatum G186AR]|uniref:Probable aspartic-type endopeptidase CTSD n=2 Tax=Ajellomyces capsulatus TaxID=5037 RepID=C0NIS4_AJECG|nr:aspartyl protease [Histoplasma capsulatum G186AR]EEH08794.1 aspartyl protease [Histoplasma capsulatum G186AR]KAG5303900.1 aspartyl protease [Histoplasma capsulatum]QSS69498.1 aspartyl protease [Histoplasma capsulatum G186AR]
MRHSPSSWHLPPLLLLLLVLSIDVVSAFFPYNPVANTDADGGGDNLLRLPSSRGLVKERFYPYSPSKSRGGQVSPQRDAKEPVKLDIIKVRGNARRRNVFQVFSADPTTLPQSLPIDTDGFDYSYFSVMYFGSERQAMFMLMDTGASNTWLISSNCTLQPCKMHNTFGIEDSNSLSVSDIPFTVSYGSGTVSGVLVNDSVSFGGFDLAHLGFGSVLSMSDEFKNYPMDGILGLGRAPAYKVKVPTVMQELKKAGLLEKNIVGVNLQRHRDGAKDGQIVFGNVDPTKFTGDISYTKTVPAVDHWEIPVDDMFVGGKPLNFQGKNGIFDTGTSFVLMPLADAQRIHDAIPKAVKSTTWEANWDLPCSTTTKIELVVSGVKYNISPKDYVGDTTTTDGMCRSKIVGHQPFEDNEWLLGATFLKNVYAVFDFDEDRIGLAMRAAEDGSDSSSPTQQPPTPSDSPPVSPVGPPSDSKTKAAGSSPNSPGSSDGAQAMSLSSVVPLLWFLLGFLFLLSSTLSPW